MENKTHGTGKRWTATIFSETDYTDIETDSRDEMLSAIDGYFREEERLAEESGAGKEWKTCGLTSGWPDGDTPVCLSTPTGTGTRYYTVRVTDAEAPAPRRPGMTGLLRRIHEAVRHHRED